MTNVKVVYVHDPLVYARKQNQKRTNSLRPCFHLDQAHNRHPQRNHFPKHMPSVPCESGHNLCPSIYANIFWWIFSCDIFSGVSPHIYSCFDLETAHRPQLLCSQWDPVTQCDSCTRWCKAWDIISHALCPIDLWTCGPLLRHISKASCWHFSSLLD